MHRAADFFYATRRRFARSLSLLPSFPRSRLAETWLGLIRFPCLLLS